MGACGSPRTGSFLVAQRADHLGADGESRVASSGLTAIWQSVEVPGEACQVHGEVHLAMVRPTPCF